MNIAPHVHGIIQGIGIAVFAIGLVLTTRLARYEWQHEVLEDKFHPSYAYYAVLLGVGASLFLGA